MCGSEPLQTSAKGERGQPFVGRCSRAGRLPGGGAVWQGSVHLAACSPVCSSGRGAGQGARRRPPCPRCWGRGGCPWRVRKGASGGGAARAKARRRESAGRCGQRERGGGGGAGWGRLGCRVRAEPFLLPAQGAPLPAFLPVPQRPSRLPGGIHSPAPAGLSLLCPGGWHRGAPGRPHAP